MQLVRRMQVESAVMTFNNLFLMMSVCFAIMLLLTPLLRKPASPAGPAPAGH